MEWVGSGTECVGLVLTRFAVVVTVVMYVTVGFCVPCAMCPVGLLLHLIKFAGGSSPEPFGCSPGWSPSSLKGSICDYDVVFCRDNSWLEVSLHITRHPILTLNNHTGEAACSMPGCEP